MRFFTKELWDAANSSDASVREQAERAWESADSQYSKVFCAISDKLPAQFLVDFLDREGLHDYLISEIIFATDGNCHSCVLKLMLAYDKVDLCMRGVSFVQASAEFRRKHDCTALEWGYCEFSSEGTDRIRLDILCSSGAELICVFDEISLITHV